MIKFRMDEGFIKSSDVGSISPFFTTDESFLQTRHHNSVLGTL